MQAFVIPGETQLVKMLMISNQSKYRIKIRKSRMIKYFSTLRDKN